MLSLFGVVGLAAVFGCGRAFLFLAVGRSVGGVWVA